MILCRALLKMDRIKTAWLPRTCCSLMHCWDLYPLRSQSKACRPLRLYSCIYEHLQYEQDWEEALCPARAENSTTIHCSGIACQECCLPAGHVWVSLSDSLSSLLQVDGGGSRLMMNHIGPHLNFHKHPWPAMNWSFIAARGCCSCCKYKRLHSCPLLFQWERTSFE